MRPFWLHVKALDKFTSQLTHKIRFTTITEATVSLIFNPTTELSWINSVGLLTTDIIT
jgi:hypothetical protein